jgi:monothiol glutaredoxin
MAITTKENLQKLLDSEDVLLFMKGTPDFPQCGFSAQVAQLLSHLGVEWTGVNVLESDSLRLAS